MNALKPETQMTTSTTEDSNKTALTGSMCKTETTGACFNQTSPAVNYNYKSSALPNTSMPLTNPHPLAGIGPPSYNFPKTNSTQIEYVSVTEFGEILDLTEI